MKGVYGIIFFMLFVCHPSLAQNDSVQIANLPFNSFLKNSYNSLEITESQDSLIVIDWKQIEKIDSTKKWKLIGFKIINSGYHAGLGELNNTITTRFYSVVGIIPIINSDTLNKHFKLDVLDFRKTRNWSYHDLSTDWTTFQHSNTLMISRRDRDIGSMYDFTTVYEYYFEEIE